MRRKTARKRRGGSTLKSTVRKGLTWIGKQLGSYGEYDKNGEFEPYNESAQIPGHLYKNYRFLHRTRKTIAERRKTHSIKTGSRSRDVSSARKRTAPSETSSPAAHLPLSTENKKAYVQMGKVMLYVEPVYLLDDSPPNTPCVIVDPASRNYIGDMSGASGVSRDIYETFHIKELKLDVHDKQQLENTDEFIAVCKTYQTVGPGVTIIHAFGPELKSNRNDRDGQHLTDVYTNVLREFQTFLDSNSKGFELLMPAISTGLFGSSNQVDGIVEACASIKIPLTVRLRVKCEMYSFFAERFGLYNLTELSLQDKVVVDSKVWYERVKMLKTLQRLNGHDST